LLPRLLACSTAALNEHCKPAVAKSISQTPSARLASR
jgi:hypothetical protein